MLTWLFCFEDGTFLNLFALIRIKKQMSINIRRAVKEDCPAMMELIRELALYEKAPEEVTVDYDHFVESGFGKQPIWWAFVAETSSHPSPHGGENEPKSEAKVVGFALYYIRYSTWKGQRMYLEDLLVTEEMRGKGIGALLFDKLMETCKEKKYSGMAWQVLEWNEPAINFYKKFDARLDGEWINCSLEMEN